MTERGGGQFVVSLFLVISLLLGIGLPFAFPCFPKRSLSRFLGSSRVFSWGGGVVRSGVEGVWFGCIRWALSDQVSFFVSLVCNAAMMVALPFWVCV